MGATEKRRDSEGPVFTGFEAIFCTILLNVFDAVLGVKGRFLKSTGTNYQSKQQLYQLTMATIRARKRTDGSISYTAQIRLIRDGVQVYQESQTFARKQAAQVWVRKWEVELDQLGAIERANRIGLRVISLGDGTASCYATMSLATKPVSRKASPKLAAWPTPVASFSICRATWTTGAVPVDNNQVESQIRPWALGRSNWLFAGSLRSGKRAAAIMGLIQSCTHESV